MMRLAAWIQSIARWQAARHPSGSLAAANISRQRIHAKACPGGRSPRPQYRRDRQAEQLPEPEARRWQYRTRLLRKREAGAVLDRPADGETRRFPYITRA